MNRTKRLKGVCSECGGSIEFPAELVGTMMPCPRCGKQTELLLAAPPEEPAVPRKVILWTVVTVVIMAAGVIALVAGLKHFEKLAARHRDAATSPVSASATEAAALAGLEVSAISLEKGQGASENYAVGTVVNKSNRQRSGVTVELDLLDAVGQQVGIARSYRPALAPGAKWQFKVPVGEAKAASAKLASIKEGQ
jgi:rRNA maturation protein Nop10